jgi:hypothetical protein
VVIEKPVGALASVPYIAWYAYPAGASIAITPGGVEFGPNTLKGWTGISGASETVTPTAGWYEWWVWLKINLIDESVAMLSGLSVTALSAAERETHLVKLIAYAEPETTSDDVESVLCMQAGNVFVPRSA